MNVGLIQDLNPLVEGGGAQATDKTLITEGFRRGHEIDVIGPNFDPAGLADYDLVIVSNATGFRPDVLRREFETRGVPWTLFVHDYPWCNWRLYFSMEEKCKTCPYLPPWKSLLVGSSLNIFMSPLHRDACFSVLPELSAQPHVLCPSLVVPWHTPTVERVPNTVFGLNSLLPYKGRQNVLGYASNHPELKFTFAGAAEGSGDIPANVSYIGSVSNTQLRHLYAASRYFIHLPATPQPCFDGESKILTETGWTPIRQVSPGCRVVSHTGQLRRVVTQMKRSYAGAMSKIDVIARSTYSFRAFRATPEHPVLTRNGWVAASQLSGHAIGLGNVCAGCGKTVPAFLKYCSRLCMNRSRTYNYRVAKDLGLELSPLQIGCLWGMMDGEGYIGIRKDGRTLRPQSHITNSNRRILQMFQDWTGMGRVREEPNHSKGGSIYRWHLESMDELYSVVKLIEPYLIVKKQAARRALSVLEQRVIERPALKNSVTAPAFLMTEIPLHPVQSYLSQRPNTVYNLEVEGDNSYICEGVAVHNCERTVIEARMSGCELILNGLVGIASYTEWLKPDVDFFDWLAKAGTTLWEKLEQHGQH